MKILLATIGSFGDINPFLALAKELKRRGHTPIVATAKYFREWIEKEGVGFLPMRPDARMDDLELVAKVVDPWKGSEYIVRKLVMPLVREIYSDLEPTARTCDLLVSHMLTYPVPLLAEKLHKPWLSTILAPLMFMSRFDVPVFPNVPWLAKLMRPLRPAARGFVLNSIKKVSRSWSRPVDDFRRELGLPPGQDPLWEGQHSPHGVLAMFSRHFAPPQVDWPPHTTCCGFPFLEKFSVEETSGTEAPLVFTLGSSAVMSAGNFYEVAAEAARTLNRPAVLVAGPQAEKLTATLPPSIRALNWASFPELFQRAAVVVHPGGIGTTAQALRGGRPQLVVPFANDQFDNADHIRRMGVGGALHKSGVTAGRLVESLRPLLHEGRFKENAARIGELIRQENGVMTACDKIEEVGKK